MVSHLFSGKEGEFIEFTVVAVVEIIIAQVGKVGEFRELVLSNHLAGQTRG